jgi:nucleotide-binding universal stress UspA family protein
MQGLGCRKGSVTVLIGIALSKPTAALVEVAEEENAELIVVGSHRRGAWDTALHGSVAAALASRATRPVLVVPVGAAKTSA